MAKEAIKITRAELYEKIWSTPATKLAEEFGMSDRSDWTRCAPQPNCEPPPNRRATQRR